LNYDEALDWLYSVRRFGPERTLGPTRHVLELLGNPHEGFSSIHVGGSNGKGSTSAMIASILEAASYKVGLFTSPHLEDFRERVRVDGELISREDVARILSTIRPLFEEMLEQSMPLRFFDIVTAMAFQYFREAGVEYAVLEVGLGGRLDATNVVDPLVSVITNIGYEHTNILGETLVEIAGEKAGIIKPGRVLVTATRDSEVFRVFKERAREVAAEVVHVSCDTCYVRICSSLAGQTFDLHSLNDYTGLYVPLLGEYQLLNAATAVAAVECLGRYGVTVPGEAIRRGLAAVQWPARLEIVMERPLVVLDCAKDAEATEAVRNSILNDIKPRFIITTHSVMGRAAEPRRIAAEVERNGRPYEVIPDEEAAFRRALELTGDEDMVLVIGSVFLAGSARSFFREAARRAA